MEADALVILGSLPFLDRAWVLPIWMSFWGCGWLGYDLEIDCVYDLEIGWGFGRMSGWEVPRGIAANPGLGVLAFLKQYAN